MKKKLFTAAVSLILCLCLSFGGVFSAAAAISIPDFLSGLLGGNTNVNLSQLFSEWLNSKIDDGDKESVIDKFVTNLKNKFNGTEPADPDADPNENPDDYVTLNKGEAENIADLFNLTVNELKNGNPAFIKNQTASMDGKIASSLQGGLGPVTGLVESLIGTKDIFAGVIDGTQSAGSSVRTKYPAGNDVINNLPVSGKNYVACLTEDDIKDYTVTIYKSGAYRMHIDLKDVEGSAASSGLAHVFETVDKAYGTMNFGLTSLNVNVMLKYVDNYVECEVNRAGMITSYTMGMGITFLFRQDDGSWSPEIPLMGVNFEDEGIIYKITTEYSGIDFALRKMGDANNDGNVNSSDARLVLRMSSNLEKCADEDFKYCDVNFDNVITAGDARLILRVSAKAESLPSTSEALGLKEYSKSEATQKHIDDLLILIMAYQAAKDAEEQKQLQDAYDDKYNNSQSEAPEETTTKLNTTGDKIEDFVGGLGDIIGGFLGK